MTEIKDDFEDTILYKFENGIDLNYEEKTRISEASDLHVKDTFDGEEGHLIFKLKGRFFCLEYAPEYSYMSDLPNFPNPIYEVRPVQVTRYEPL